MKKGIINKKYFSKELNSFVVQTVNPKLEWKGCDAPLGSEEYERKWKKYLSKKYHSYQFKDFWSFYKFVIY